MNTIEIYGKDNCPWCERAKTLVKRRGYPFVYYNMSDDPSLMDEFVTRTNGARTVPQVFVDNIRIGGFTEFEASDRNGELAQLVGGC